MATLVKQAPLPNYFRTRWCNSVSVPGVAHSFAHAEMINKSWSVFMMKTILVSLIIIQYSFYCVQTPELFIYRFVFLSSALLLFFTHFSHFLHSFTILFFSLTNNFISTKPKLLKWLACVAAGSELLRGLGLLLTATPSHNAFLTVFNLLFWERCSLIAPKGQKHTDFKALNTTKLPSINQGNFKEITSHFKEI